MKIYFDTNIYCRPFDNLTEPRIFNEATASLNLFLLSISKIIQIITSEMVLTEISLISSIAKRDAVKLLLFNNFTECVAITSKIDNVAKKINTQCKINDYADCLHLALACISSCNYFITCDDEILEKSSVIESVIGKLEFTLKIKNPIYLLKELEVK